MLEFIKMFGLGILYTILFPFLVIIFALFLVYVFVDYIVLEIKTLVGFFFGYTFTTDTELELQLEELKEAKSEVQENDVLEEVKESEGDVQ